MKQAILEIIDRKMEQRTPYKEKMPLHKTLGYEVCHGGYIVLQELREEISKMDEWILVTERLPNEGESVLVSLQGILYMAYYYPEKTGNQWYFGGDYIDTPDFWIPLPLPPHPSSHV